MARQRDPRRDQAKEIWLKSKGDKSLKELASELGVSDSQLRKWKSVDKWNDELKSNVTNAKGNITIPMGAPKGNKNAVGNRGNTSASAKPGNKNALKTGEHETIFFDVLSEEEREIYSQVVDDPLVVLSEEIRLLKVRQYRMLKRINDAEAGLNQEEIERLQQLRKVKEPVNRNGKVIEIKREMLKDVQVTRKTFRKLDDIMAIEDALTRVSNQLQKAIKQLNEAMLREQKSDLLDAQIANLRARVKEDGEPDEMEDDGFLAALESEGEQLWPEE